MIEYIIVFLVFAASMLASFLFLGGVFGKGDTPDKKLQKEDNKNKKKSLEIGRKSDVPIENNIREAIEDKLDKKKNKNSKGSKEDLGKKNTGEVNKKDKNNVNVAKKGNNKSLDEKKSKKVEDLSPETELDLNSWEIAKSKKTTKKSKSSLNAEPKLSTSPKSEKINKEKKVEAFISENSKPIVKSEPIINSVEVKSENCLQKKESIIRDNITYSEICSNNIKPKDTEFYENLSKEELKRLEKELEICTITLKKQEEINNSFDNNTNPSEKVTPNGDAEIPKNILVTENGNAQIQEIKEKPSLCDNIEDIDSEDLNPKTDLKSCKNHIKEQDFPIQTQIFSKEPEIIIPLEIQEQSNISSEEVTPNGNAEVKEISLYSKIKGTFVNNCQDLSTNTKDLREEELNSRNLNNIEKEITEICKNHTEEHISISQEVTEKTNGDKIPILCDKIEQIVEQYFEVIEKDPETELFVIKNSEDLCPKTDHLEEVEIVENCINQPRENYSCTLEYLKQDSSVETQKILKEATASPESIPTTNETVKMPAIAQVRVLTLNDNEHQISTIYRIEHDWIIQFRLGPSLLGRKVSLKCNYPVEKKEFKREVYQQLPWLKEHENSDDTALYAQITAQIAGSFHFYFVYGESEEPRGSGYFLVDPVIKVGVNDTLPLDCIQCQTVLAKNLGSFSTWENKLRVAKESGYNMIHFTPIQELGVSNSCYSLSEQLKLNPGFQKNDGSMVTYDEVEELTNKMRSEWKVASICDIVLNHTANESEWLVDHPEVTYNCQNCLYMRPAYLLDAALHTFSMDVKNGVYDTRGIPPEVSTEDHLNAIRYHLHTSVLQPLKLQELMICDVSKIVVEFLNAAKSVEPNTQGVCKENLELIQDPEYRRLKSGVHMELAMKLYNVYRPDCFDEDSRIRKCTEEFKNVLDSLNNAVISELNDHLNAAVENTIAGLRYFRVQHDGPKVREITIKNPLVFRYFTDHGEPKTLQDHEALMYSPNGKYLMAHNGWVMNSDPLRNFAAQDSNVYIRRELIAWGDSVKLRYGDKPEDCPYLWEHMKKYVKDTVRIFDGVRLDNCHSTPIPVAEYLLDFARTVRPDLYVVAELFTNSDMTDNIFVNRLGITSLIREAMSAGDSHEEGRLVYRYGGQPVGSFLQPPTRPLVPSVAHALFLDLTHDNPSPVEKRSVFDMLPSTALVNMAACASGSNRGYDELVPHHIHVVDESREYTEWATDEKLAVGNAKYVTDKTGIVPAKKVLNDIHYKLGRDGFNQVYVDQMDADIVAVTRHNPESHESYILVAFTAFGHPGEFSENQQRNIKPLRFEGNLVEIAVEATLSHVGVKSGKSKFTNSNNFVKDNKFINGLSEYQVSLKEHIQLPESDIFEKSDSGTENVAQLNFKNFKPGSIVIVRVSLPDAMQKAVQSVRKLMAEFAISKETKLTKIIKKMTLFDLNRALYRCDQEENDEFNHIHAYNIPGFGSLIYAGLQGFMTVMSNIRPSNDLGHPMCGNLRDGNWMIDYIWQRLILNPGTQELGKWIEENVKCFNNIPRYLVPCYFDVVLTGLYTLLLEQCYNSMTDFVKDGSTFVRALALGSVQLTGYVKSAQLPQLSPNLAPPKPPTRINDKGDAEEACATLSAGLPHFSTGYMRNWGRDTFIALRGNLILTGRYEEARQHILGYAATLRHGLIPNLLFGGVQARFNCRDAIWWWLYCIREYCTDVPNGLNILNDEVSRIFPTDESEPTPAGSVDQPLHEIMQEALNVHFQGLAFRERNAGSQIDAHMTEKGFNNQIGVHPETGFVFGGNEMNCGTWMDKMGSSDKAGNRGKPATPRDGSAVELVGLSYAVVSWLHSLNVEKKFPHSGVTRTHKNGSKTTWSYYEWAGKIKANFEKYFWVNTAPVEGEIRPDLINKRGIYKDCYGASQDWTDFQLRCNVPVAMCVAPEIFNPQHAWEALKQTEKYLLGPLGMKTLDPEDWAYDGNYDNSNDSTDFKLAHGLNYHQGPEWVWPMGFFLRAKLHFAAQNNAQQETVSKLKTILSRHFVELQTSPWRGLPELTNKDGAYCNDSCRTQAWSMSCILEVLYDLQKIEAKLMKGN
ncbi:unnamed protein product [Brassicogethes aeneus]|uniref:Glycogen debranching enzyme n=1 Tax=Brassicogethes aeneus TaxID=1431903 RepID=A0A9P0B320_BRAAE|nr:unnamed protein product [Brassicogethes aeneus]